MPIHAPATRARIARHPRPLRCCSFKEGYDRVADGFTDACTTPARADLIIGTAMTVTFALSIAEALSTPVWIAKLAPELPSRAFTTPGECRVQYCQALVRPHRIAPLACLCRN